MNIQGGKIGGLGKRYEVTDCEFNQRNYPLYIGEIFVNPPAYMRVEVVWVDPMDWPEIN